jgi:glycosyltransferase involved in cell wall biosynthesis
MNAPIVHAADSTERRLLVSAFGIHMGGGMVLLDALLRAARAQTRVALIDARVPRSSVPGDDGMQVIRIARTFTARVVSLLSLAARARTGDVLFCFNSLPPLRSSKAYVITYVHAPHFVAAHTGIRYSALTALRLRVERAWFGFGIRHANEVWVQTDSMVAAMLALYPSANVQRVALVDSALFQGLSDEAGRQAPSTADGTNHTFFYPADGVGHKNHGRLLAAWKLLNELGLRPQLVLTLTRDEWRDAQALSGVDLSTMPAVITVGRISRSAVLEQMRQCNAVIFPSLAETFGLPMLEARVLGTPILASERDFVRDVCAPQQTFDPASARSIAMAVRRFITGDELPDTPFYSAEQLVKRLLSCAS